MHGFIYWLGPGWNGYPTTASQPYRDINSPQKARKKRPMSDETEMEFILAVTLAIALMIDIALTAHFVA